MKYGIRYRGVHSGEVGLIAKTKTRPAAPPVRTTEETILYRDGNLDYSESGGRLFYDDKIVEIEFMAITPDLVDTNMVITRAVKWLCGSWGDLIFDDMPLVRWRAKPIDLSSVSIELYRAGKFTVQFRCRPFNNLLFDTSGIEIDSDIPIDSDVPLDFGDDNVYEMASTGYFSFTHTNTGDVAARPKIYITGQTDSGAHTITIKVNGTGFTLKFPSNNLLNGGKLAIVDCEECAVTCEGADITSYLVDTTDTYSEFPELQPGENAIWVNTSITGSMEFIYAAPFFYGADNLGGDDNA